MYCRLSIICLILWWYTNPSAHGQQAASMSNSQWFSKNFVIDWRNGEPEVKVLFDTEQASNSENSAFVCDPVTGDLLLYTDGIKLYDGRGNLVHDNIGGRYSTHQNSLIAPVSDTTFLVIGNGALHGIYDRFNKLFIHLIYYNKKNGLSEVLKTYQTPSDFTAFEMIAFAPNPAEDCSFWLVCMGSKANQIYAIPVKQNGELLFDQAIISPLTVFPDNAEVLRGHIRLSDDYKKIAFGMQSRGIAVGDFDPVSGKVSNVSNILTDPIETGYTSIFSPSNDKLYYIFGYFGYHGKVMSLDLNTGQKSLLSNVNGYGGFQLGPDDNIYVTGKRKEYYAVIKRPNSDKPVFKERAIYLGEGNTSNYSPGMLSIFDMNSTCEVQRACDTVVIREEIFICEESFLLNEETITEDTVLVDWYTNEYNCPEKHETHYLFQEDKTLLPVQFFCRADNTPSPDTSYLTNRHGCDSLVIQPYKSLESIPLEQNLYLCPDQDICFLNNCYAQPGVYFDTLISTDRTCQKIIKLTVEEAFKYTKEINRTLCTGEYLILEQDTIRNSGKYIYRYNSQYGCDSTIIYSVKVLTADNFIFLDTTVCLGDTLELYDGFPFDIFSTYPDIDNPQSGIPVNHDMLVEGVLKNCYGNDLDISVIIRAEPIPQMDVEIPNSLTEHEASTFHVYSSFENDLFFYENDKPSEILGDSIQFTPEFYTNYAVKVVSPFGCSYREPLSFEIKPKIYTCQDANIFTPNFISPNADGRNDDFRFTYDKVMRFDLLTIYDRWGGKVFETKNPTEEFWDGSVDGTMAENGVFVFKLLYTCSDGKPKVHVGNITVAY